MIYEYEMIDPEIVLFVLMFIIIGIACRWFLKKSYDVLNSKGETK